MEADEYAGNFDPYRPDIAIVTTNEDPFLVRGNLAGQQSSGVHVAAGGDADQQPRLAGEPLDHPVGLLGRPLPGLVGTISHNLPLRMILNAAAGDDPLAQADQAMYRAKNEGRNRVLAATTTGTGTASIANARSTK